MQRASFKGTRRFFRAQPLALLLVSLCGFLQKTYGAVFSISDLGTLGGSYSLGYGINNSGNVTGETETTNTLTHGFIYRTGTMNDLIEFGFGQFYSTGHGINDSNDVVGQAAVTGFYRAILVSGTNRTDLGTLGGDYSNAYGINDPGQVVGESTLAPAQGGFTHAFLRTGSTMNDIGTLGGNYSSARMVNKLGHVVGEANTISNETHAFFYNGASMADLGTFGGQESSASGINDSDAVVGYAVTGAGAAHAFFYTNGVLSDLGTLGGLESAANAINNKGQIVGYFTFLNGGSTNTHPFYYDGKTMYDLNVWLPPDSPWTELTSAQGINDLGQITGYGQIGGQTHAFLITPCLTFQSPQLLANGNFEVRLDGLPGQNWDIQGSTDLTNWSSLQTVATGATSFTDTNTNNFRYQFYRGLLTR
jgi:probable HAF family extracellular repeat protein